jgi:hypothetical protein
MIRSCSQKILLIALLLAATSPAMFADLFSIDFEGPSDSTFISTQYPNLTVSNAIIFTSGISLNELDFPPHSGVNVVSDAGGPISIAFSMPALDFLGYFNYVVPVTIQGYDSSNNLLAAATSLFSNNTVSFGDPGSSPNELLEIASATGFSRVVITGDPSGGSFTLDDITYTTGQVGSVPEPSSVVLTLTVLLAANAIRRRRRVHNPL